MWRALTKDDLMDSVSEKEIESYDNAVSAAVGGRPRHESLILRTVALVRAYVRSSPKRIAMSPDGAALPESLVAPAMDYAAVDVVKRLPGAAVSKERNDSRAAAIKLFESIRDGGLSPEPYGDSREPDEGSAQLAASSRRRVTSTRLEVTP